ncbi:MAG: TIGR03905 family TSCPD domain-containing protein [Firmicutes bacterium]|nr:TIGR03905 family TSCPD domain-containing protein [Bacillota bacterium]
MKYGYKTSGTCSRYIEFEVEDGIVHNVAFTGGCNGNLKAIGKLVEGMKVEDVIERVQGVDCGGRGTSCGDQLARALTAAMEAGAK